MRYFSEHRKSRMFPAATVSFRFYFLILFFSFVPGYMQPKFAYFFRKPIVMLSVNLICRVLIFLEIACSTIFHYLHTIKKNRRSIRPAASLLFGFIYFCTSLFKHTFVQFFYYFITTFIFFICHSISVNNIIYTFLFYQLFYSVCIS